MIKRIVCVLLLLSITGLLFGCGKNNPQPVVGSVTKNNSGIAANANANLDTTPPAIASISAPNATSVAITFSELLNKQSAETTSNYSIPGLTVVSATLGPDLKTVTLVTTPQGGASYSVQVSGVKDIYGNSMGAGTTNSSANFSPGNITPTANAGLDQVVTPNNLVTLDGTGSSDGDNDTLSYIWSIVSQPGGANVSLSSTTAAQPSFTTNILGNYIFQLIVSDGKVTSNADTVTILINSRPTANAGADQHGTTNITVTLDGSGSSDPDGDVITYLWQVTTQPNTSAVALSSTSTQQPTFTPTVKGNYVFSLLVTDARGATSSVDTVTIDVTGNSTPAANAGADDATHHVGTSHTLDGTGSLDADGDSLTYAWSLVSQPAGSVYAIPPANSTLQSFAFTPNITGNYTFQLIVSDGIASSNADTVNITVTNTAPVVDTGLNNYQVTPNTAFIISITATDSDADLLTRQWEIITSPNGSIANLIFDGDVSRIYQVDKPGLYEFKLSVSDGYVTSNDTVKIYANTSPNAVASASFYAGSNVTKNVLTYLYGGSSSDPDGDSYTYSWDWFSWPSGTSAGIINSASATANFTPDKMGTYVFRLTVTDNPPTDNTGLANKSTTAYVTINVTTATEYSFSSKYTNVNWNILGLTGDDTGTNIYVSVDGSAIATSNTGIYKFSSNFTTTSVPVHINTNTTGTGNAEFMMPYGIDYDGSFFYIADASVFREDVQKLPYSGGASVGFIDKVGETGVSGDGSNRFNDPRGVCHDSNNIYIVDAGNKKVKIYKNDLSYINSILFSNTPWGICYSSSSNIVYVSCADRKIHRIQNNVEISLLDTSGTLSIFPGGICADVDGYLYTSDQGDHKIYKINPSTGVKICQIGTFGAANGQLTSPVDVFVDKYGYVYIADSGNHRIQKFVPQ